MIKVSLERARANLAELLDRAEAGEEILIVRPERSMVRLGIVRSSRHEGRRPRTPGQLRHLRAAFPDSFFEPVYSEAELKEIEEAALDPRERTE